MKRFAPALLAVLALAGCGGSDAPVSKEIRARPLTLAPDVSAGDRAWIDAALKEARPEAASLIDDVDGMVMLSTVYVPNGGFTGLARQTGEHAYEIQLNTFYLDGDRKADRAKTVLHEFGHIVDFAVTPTALRNRLAAELPTVGSCLGDGHGDCTEPRERFADTFAKWALRGAVSLHGAGYGVGSPASLEDWGAPLAQLAIELDVKINA